MLVDRAHDADEAVRARARLLLELLTPIVKAWGSDYALKANELAIQILGGYGYTRDYPVEQYYRDNRINPIHEGTNGIQALDLLGRKAMMQDGARAEAAAARRSARPAPRLRRWRIAAAAGAATVRRREARRRDHARGGPAHGRRRGAPRAGQCQPLHDPARATWRSAGSGCGRRWSRSARCRPRATPTRDFYRGKLQACRFFFATELPQIEHVARLVQRGRAERVRDARRSGSSPTVATPAPLTPTAPRIRGDSRRPVASGSAGASRRHARPRSSSFPRQRDIHRPGTSASPQAIGPTA